MILTGEYLLFFTLFGSGLVSEKLTFIDFLDVDRLFLIADFGLCLSLVLFPIGPGLLEEGRRFEMLENLSFLTFFTLETGF